MATMGRRRKSADTGLEPRVYQNHGKFFYVHRDTGRWENLGADREEANRRARLYNDPDGMHGTLVYWFDLFIVECEQRVAAGDMSARTLKDYRHALVGKPETRQAKAKPSALRLFYAPPRTPLDVKPENVQEFIDLCAKLKRPIQGNREKAALSSCISWLIRTGKVPGLVVNPCMSASGIQRNTEKKRQRYVTHDEYREVWAQANPRVQLLMDLTYRTLQRPESDIILWTTANLVTDQGRRKLKFIQNKTKMPMLVELPAEVDARLRAGAGDVPRLRQPLVKRLDGEAYTYTGLMSMLTRAIDKANAVRAKRGDEPMAAFGFRDLKGKGATDMYYIQKVPIEQIQQLLGHASKTTTEIYIKQRWRETAAPNMVAMA